jgi:hypothetical protein
LHLLQKVVVGVLLKVLQVQMQLELLEVLVVVHIIQLPQLFLEHNHLNQDYRELLDLEIHPEQLQDQQWQRRLVEVVLVEHLHQYHLHLMINLKVVLLSQIVLKTERQNIMLQAGDLMDTPQVDLPAEIQIHLLLAVLQVQLGQH